MVNTEHKLKIAASCTFENLKVNVYDEGMAPPIGGVDSGGRSRDFSLADIAAISGSCVSYIFTNLANLRTPERKARPESMLNQVK